MRKISPKLKHSLWVFVKLKISLCSDIHHILKGLKYKSYQEIFAWSIQFSSVQFSGSVVSDTWRPHQSQHARPPCPSSAPGVHSNSRPSSWWCHPTISSSGVPFSSHPQSLPASVSFPMSQLFTWGDRSTGVSALASFLHGLRLWQKWSPCLDDQLKKSCNNLPSTWVCAQPTRWPSLITWLKLTCLTLSLKC